MKNEKEPEPRQLDEDALDQVAGGVRVRRFSRQATGGTPVKESGERGGTIDINIGVGDD